MANVTFIEGVVNSLFDQSTGEVVITETNAQDVISLGDKVLNSAEDKDVFLKTLVDRIGKTIISTRPYISQLKNIVMNDMEYGTLVQKIYVAPFIAEKNEGWDLEDGADISTVYLKKPTVIQKLFENRDTLRFEVSIPDYQLRTAFTGATALSAFIEGIFTSLETSIESALENLANLCVANFMAEKIQYAKDNAGEGVHAVYLLKDYNEGKEVALTADKAMENKDFLKYCAKTIKLNKKRMSRLGEVYNTEGFVRHTPEKDLKMLFLADYVAASEFYLEAETFHNEFVTLDGYSEVSYWQGQGKTGAFDDVSQINITTTSGDSVIQKGIVAFLFDRDALGVMIQRNEAYAQYYPKRNVTQHWENIDRGYFNDLSENAIVFIIADEPGAEEAGA